METIVPEESACGCSEIAKCLSVGFSLAFISRAICCSSCVVYHPFIAEFGTTNKNASGFPIGCDAPVGRFAICPITPAQIVV